MYRLWELEREGHVIVRQIRIGTEKDKEGEITSLGYSLTGGGIVTIGSEYFEGLDAAREADDDYTGNFI